MHESNAKFEIEATLKGITIDLRPESANVDASISEITDPGAKVVANVEDLHSWNALAPSDVNFEGRTMEPSDVHDWNALALNDVKVGGRTIEPSDVQNLNALAPISLNTEPGANVAVTNDVHD